MVTSFRHSRKNRIEKEDFKVSRNVQYFLDLWNKEIRSLRLKFEIFCVLTITLTHSL